MLDRHRLRPSSRPLYSLAALGMLLAAALLIGVPDARAQDVEVTGTVVDAEDQTTLPGVNVRVAGTNRGTTTDAEG